MRMSVHADLKALFSTGTKPRYYRNYELTFENGQPTFILSEIDVALEEAIRRWCGETPES